MFSLAPNIVLVPNMTQNAERKHRTQNTNTAHIRLHILLPFYCYSIALVKAIAILLMPAD